MDFLKLNKLHAGDKVAVLSPSFAAPARWPHVYQLGLKRLKESFGLIPIEYPTTCSLTAGVNERQRDLEQAFGNSEIKAIITTIGGDHQVTYAKKINAELVRANPKPFFGYSDNTHIANFLWLNGIPSYYGGCLFTEFAMQGRMDKLTMQYLKQALFQNGELELEATEEFNDVGLNWDDPENLTQTREYEINEGWIFNGDKSSEGIIWGGCLESLDELLRHRLPIPSLDQFSSIVLILETSEELPSHAYVHRVIRAFGELGIIERLRGVLVGRPKAWSYENPANLAQRNSYRIAQRDVILSGIRNYNSKIPVIQNLDFGHTSPQICLPLGQKVRINAKEKRIWAEF